MREELPRHDTGAWSLYSLGRVSRESDLGYHLLVRDFLAGLCRRAAGAPYCAASERFTAYTREPPVLRLRTRRVRAGATRAVSFGLSKVSRVGVRISQGGRRVLVRELGTLPYGRASFAWDVPRRAGRYTVVLSAVDMAGNAGSTTAELVVARARRRERP